MRPSTPRHLGAAALVAAVAALAASLAPSPAPRTTSGASGLALAEMTTAARPTSRADADGTLLVSSPGDATQRLTPRAPETPPSGAVVTTVHVDTTAPAQTWRGVGAALTDASVAMLDGRPDLVADLLDPAGAGARLNLLRLPLTATDMSTTAWGWHRVGGRWRPAGPGRRAIAVLRREVLPVAPDLQVVASPWSAPPSMKTNGSWFGGALRRDAVREYAGLLETQARWLVDHDVPLAAMTLANEPGLASDYPTMRVSDGQLRRLARLVHTTLAGLGVQLWGLDHNWSDRGRLDGTGFEGLDAVAFHCYAGTPADVGALPVPWLVDECTGTADGAVASIRYDLRTLVRDSLGAGSTGLVLWNLALPPGYRGAWGGCTDCRGLLTVDGGTAYREPEFYTLAHLARAAAPGSRVVPTDLPDDLPGAAFLGPGAGGTVGVVLLDDTSGTRWVRFATPTGTTDPFRLEASELATWSSGS